MRKDGLGSYRLEIAEEAVTFSAFVPAREGELPDALVDARLRLEDTYFSIFNPRCECTGINLRLTSPKHLAVLPHGPENPFAAPLVSFLALNPFQLVPALLHRHRRVVTVTLHHQRPAWRGKGAQFQNLDRGQSR
jgi:hypothetical protein